MNYPAFIRHIW